MSIVATPPADSKFLQLDGERIEYRYQAADDPAAPTLVFLHQGLGSVSVWREVPLRLAALTGCAAFWYSRTGYGWSGPEGKDREADYLLAEAHKLPRLLEAMALRDIILVGHSDGGTIALAYLGSGHPARAVIAVAPHVRDERLTYETIQTQREQWGITPLRKLLQRHHRDADETFMSWTDIWLSPSFRGWSIESLLPSVRVPALGLQGYQDTSGTMMHIDTMARLISAPVELVKYEQCGHDPFRERPQETLEACADFLRRHANTPA